MALFGKPLAYTYIVSGWGEPRAYRGGIHKGLDARAPIGTEVFAIGSGKVIISKDYGTNTGKWIAIEHDNGFISRYLHLDRRFIEVDERAEKGQMIAWSGDTGISSSAPHLHVDLKRNGQAIPGEPFIAADEYAADVIANALKHGLPLAGKPIATALVVGATIGGAYVLWKYVIKPRGGLI